MAILAQNLADEMRFALDAENAEHYGDDEDIVPAINSATRWLTSVINAALGEKKLGEEIFRDLTFSRVFRTSVDSRISLDVFPDEPWSLLAIYPNPTTGTTGGTFVPPISNKQSALRTDLYHRDADSSAKRLTIEEWSINKGNPFAAGYEFVPNCDELTLYSYLDPFDYASDTITSVRREIEVRPAIVNDNVTVFYLKRPTPIADLTGIVEFPDSVFSLLFNKALSYIAYKQGDNTTLNSVTNQDIQLLLAAIN